MSSISQSKDHHWKLVSNRKSRMDSVFDQVAAKKKFTPLKDNSIHDSKIFERSRERSNSSFAGLNKSQDAETVQTKDKKNDKICQSTKVIHPQQSVRISALKNSQFRLTDSVKSTKHQASAIKTIAEVQKQFKQFKEKVMKLIQRQQQQINQLAKEILNTFQFQLTKIKQIKVNMCENCQLESEISKQHSKALEPPKILLNSIKKEAKNQHNLKPKQIEDLKQDLNKRLQKIQNTSPALKTNQKSNTQLQKSKSVREIPMLNFQKIHSRFDNVFEIFNKLKSDMSEMEQIKVNSQKKKNSETNLPYLTQKK